MARDTRKTLKRGKMKNEKVQEKFNSVIKTVKFFTFIFCIRKRIYIARKHILGKCSSYNYISSKVLVLQDI